MAVYKILGSLCFFLDFPENSALLSWLLLLLLLFLLFLLFHLYVAFQKSGTNLTVLPLEDVCFLCFEALGTFWSSNSNAVIRICPRKIILGQLDVVPGGSAPGVTRLLWGCPASSTVRAGSVCSSRSWLSATCARTPVTFLLILFSFFSACVQYLLSHFHVNVTFLLRCHLHVWDTSVLFFSFLCSVIFPFCPLADSCTFSMFEVPIHFLKITFLRIFNGVWSHSIIFFCFFFFFSWRKGIGNAWNVLVFSFCVLLRVHLWSVTACVWAFGDTVSTHRGWEAAAQDGTRGRWSGRLSFPARQDLSPPAPRRASLPSHRLSPWREPSQQRSLEPVPSSVSPQSAPPSRILPGQFLFEILRAILVHPVVRTFTQSSTFSHFWAVFQDSELCSLALKALGRTLSRRSSAQQMTRRL